mgnify:CR=1 FL=1
MMMMRWDQKKKKKKKKMERKDAELEWRVRSEQQGEQHGEEREQREQRERLLVAYLGLVRSAVPMVSAVTWCLVSSISLSFSLAVCLIHMRPLQP